MIDLSDASRLLVLSAVALLAYVAVVLGTGADVALLEVAVFGLGVLAVLALFARYETR